MEYGCIAEHLGHSFSKEIHAALADYAYELRELAPGEVEAFLKQRDFRGINVTIPYKQAVIPFLDDVSPIAREIGAVNTIVRRGDRLYGDNTDFCGMKYLLQRENINLRSKKVLIFGSGGTSRTAQAVARSLGAAEIVVVSRREGAGTMTFAQVRRRCTDAQIIINTTPVGMFPREDELPYCIELAEFLRLEGLVDVIYHPLRSELVLAARARGIPAVGGLRMLVMQAAAAAERFLDTTLPEERIAAVEREIQRSKENLVLIGMPGCGKSTVAKLLAARYGKELIDTDQLVLERTGRPPCAWIETCGEATFRELEARAVSVAASKSGAVIATGGGVILREDNVRRLRRGGRLIFLDRPLELLAVSEDRPLSCDRAQLQRRYRERIELYRRAADGIVDASSDAETVAEAVSRCFERMLAQSEATSAGEKNERTEAK